MLAMLGCLLLSVIPHQEIVCNNVDVLEINTFYIEGVVGNIKQIILWEWSPEHEIFVVVDYWTPSKMPECIADDTIMFKEKLVKFGFKIKTETDYDPEVYNRRYLDNSSRRPLK